VISNTHPILTPIFRYFTLPPVVQARLRSITDFDISLIFW